MASRKLLGGVVATMMIAQLLTPISFAQSTNSNDAIIGDLIGTTATRGFSSTDKAAVKVIAKTANSVTLEMPVAKKDGKEIDKYYVTWAPLSYKEITTNSNADDMKLVKTSDDVKMPDGTPIYKIVNGKLQVMITVADTTKDVYVTIAPEDANRNTGAQIEDYKFNLATVQVTSGTTAVAGDVSQTNVNRAIVNVSCVWDATANRTTLTWDLNTALSASTVEISNRPQETQGEMVVKGTPSITDRKFAVDTAHREIQLFRLKPLDGAGAMVGEEIQYICKPDVVTTPTPTTPATPITPTNPAKPIPVTPHTGPVETLAIVFFISLLGYFVYKKSRA